MIFSIHAGKSFEKVQHPYKREIHNLMEIEGNFLNLIKGTYKKD